MQQTAKKAKVEDADDGLVWRASFHQTNGLKTLIDVVCNILTRINLSISYDADKGESHLCIDSIDPQQVCMIKARLQCENTKGIEKKTEFCIESSVLNLFLKSLPAHYSVNLEQREGSSDLRVFAYETLNANHTTELLMPTFMDDGETMQLFDMKYDYTLEMDLTTLRQHVKMSQALNAKHLTFKVYEPPDEDTDDKTRKSLLTIESRDGDSRYKQSFHSATIREENQDTCTIRAALDSTDPDKSHASWKLKFDEDFSTQYMNHFLKSMDRQVITMKLTKDRPFIMNYQLSADGCYVCFVLAPKTRDDDE